MKPEWWVADPVDHEDSRRLFTLQIGVSAGDIEAVRTWLRGGRPTYPYPRVFLRATDAVISAAEPPDES